MEIVSQGFVSFDNIGMINLSQYFELSKQLFLHTIFVNDGFKNLFKGIQSVGSNVSEL